MINLKKIQEAFKGLIGFRKSFDTNDKSIDDDLQESTSGIFVNDLHDLFTVKNIAATIQGIDIVLESYSNIKTYKIGDIVSNGTVAYYVSLVDDNLNFAVSNTTKWKPTSLFSQFLIQKYNFSVNQVVQKFLSLKKEFSQAKELLQRVALFDAFGGETMNKQGSFVGYQINVKSPLLANIIKRVGIQLVENDTITFYLFHSSSSTAIATKEIVYTNAKRFQWFDLTDFILKKTSDTFEDGYFTIGYFESDLNTNNNAINAKVNLGNDYDCSSCNYSNVRLLDLWSEYFNIRPIEVQSSKLNAFTQSWAYDDAIVYVDRNFGINLLFSVECDFTDVITDNVNLFIPVLSEQLRLTFLNSIANTQRHNQDAIESANLANHWLKEGGYEKALKTEIENINFDLSNIDSNCLPCDKTKNNITVDALW